MIIILTQCFPSRLGGIESLVSNLALGLGKKENARKNQKNGYGMIKLP